jgi:WD40 repeat protein
MLSSCDIEAREGRLLAVGGVDTKVYVLGINPEIKKREKINHLSNICELTAHSGLISSVKFLNSSFLVSGSDDSSLLLWDLNKPDQYLVKYNDH